MITREQTDNLVGAKVYDPSGLKIGSVGQVYLANGGHPAWISVRTGLFGTNESLVPLDEASRLDRDSLHVSATRSMVRNAPRITADNGQLTDHSSAELYRYYNMKAPAAGERRPDQAANQPNTAVQREQHSAAGRRRAAQAANMPATADPRAARAATGHDNRGQDLNITRFEEQLRVGKETVETGHVRLIKHVVTEEVNTSVPVSHEEIRVVREPITSGQADGTHRFADEDTEVVLHEERILISKESVPVERIRLSTETLTEQQAIKDTLRKERIDITDDRENKHTEGLDM